MVQQIGGRKMIKHKTISVALAVVIGVLTLALTAASADRTDEDLRAFVPKVVAAWGTMDISKVAPYYAKDADLTYFDITPLKYNNWKEYSEGVQKYLFEPNRSISAKVNDDLAVHHRGTMAWAYFMAGIDIVSKEG